MLTLLARPGAAGAQDTGGSEPTQEAGPDDHERAVILYEQARDLYDAGDFERSVVFLEEAVALSDTPALHYNLGRALQELGRWEEARDQYGLYLEQEPETPQRTRVEARIALLEERIHPAVALEPSPARPNPLAADRSTPIAPAPWVLAGAGVVTIAAAIPFAVLFSEAHESARRASTHEMAYGPAQDALMFAIVADVLFGVGGLAAAAGVVWGLVEVTGGDAAVQVRLGPGRAEVSGRF